MKILFYQWKAYNQRDIEQALLRRGHQVEGFWMEMGNFEKDDVFEAAFCGKLLTLTEENTLVPAYDLVFSVNYFPLISDICERYGESGLKYAAWTCDSPLSTMYHQSIFNRCNYVFIFDKVCYQAFREMGARVFYLPLAAAVERAGEAISAAEQEKGNPGANEADGAQGMMPYRHEVTFVGSMYRKNSYDEIKDMLPDYLRGYFDALMLMQMEIYGENYIDDMLTGEILAELNKHFNIEKSERSFSNLSLIFSTTVLGFKIARMERYKLINALSKHFPVSVYTDDEEAEFPLAENLGPVSYWEESPVVFHTSRINLNFTVRNIRSGIPLRVWDILAAGGFCITNFQLELPLYFENGKDLVWFEDERDLIGKVKYYLEHDEERRAIAKNGRRKVKEFHNYDVRLDELEKYLNGTTT